jgi:hypothetical protein
MKKRWGVILLIIGILTIACIGYFMFTSTVSSPTTMSLFIPRDSEKDSVDQYSGVKTKLTLILLKDDKVFGYYGDSIKGGRSVSLDETDKLIIHGWQLFSKDSLIIVIKPSEAASYKATVDILDKMSINKIEKFSMTDVNKQEKEFLEMTE